MQNITDAIAFAEAGVLEPDPTVWRAWRTTDEATRKLRVTLQNGSWIVYDYSDSSRGSVTVPTPLDNELADVIWRNCDPHNWVPR